MIKTVLYNITQLVPVEGSFPRRGADMGQLNKIENACVVIEDEVITFVGTMDEAMAFDKSLFDHCDIDISYCEKEISIESAGIIKEELEGLVITYIDCFGHTVLPGFVDSHTHFVYGGSREEEFKLRLNGADYMEILNAGGGINSTVKSTRKAPFEHLLETSLERLEKMLAMGVTTVEGKSGYGLDVETELKQLKVMKELNKLQPVDVVSTFMGPHSVPNEYKFMNPEIKARVYNPGEQKKIKTDTRGYLNFVIKEVLPKVVSNDLAEFADVFCEKGVFNIEESRLYLKAAKDMGLKLKIHADEIVSLGGAELGTEMGAVSADHLLAASDKGIEALANGNTVATLLPATAYSLREPFANVRKMIDKGCAVALASDYNPGSCPTHSIPLIISLAALNMNMSIEEIICGLTINGAAALGREKEIGSLEVGKKGDIVILNEPSIDFLPYRIGMNLVDKVVKNGHLVWINV